MKKLLVISFVFFSFVAVAQTAKQQEQPAIKSDSVVVHLTDWQEKQIIAFDQARKAIDDQSKLLLQAILDVNKIDEKKITKMDYRPGKLVFKLKQ